MSDGFLNMLGLCKRANRLNAGHDSSFDSISKNKAKLCLITKDASDRLKKEFERTISFDKRDIPLIVLDYTMDQIYSAIGTKAVVITVNDEGFAKRLKGLLEIREEEDV
ncbi:MAG: ribosomal L7Ae/L30e/S12e/Gadd45 family protein [Oscillospiraceae bacterium]|nr:ribosomal L7Ae/L30e/S12e/Gadd45 family protein [Oscillospiraceae bacterium]